MSSTTEAGHSLLVPGTSVVATAIPSGGAAVTSLATLVVSSVATAVVSTVASTPTQSSVVGGTVPAGKYFYLSGIL